MPAKSPELVSTGTATFQPMCGTFIFPDGSRSFVKRLHSASIQPSPGRVPSSLPRVRSCIPRQIPSTGVFFSWTHVSRTPTRSCLFSCSMPASKAPTPGKSSLGAARSSARSRLAFAGIDRNFNMLRMEPMFPTS